MYQNHGVCGSVSGWHLQTSLHDLPPTPLEAIWPEAQVHPQFVCHHNLLMPAAPPTPTTSTQSWAASHQLIMDGTHAFPNSIAGNVPAANVEHLGPGLRDNHVHSRSRSPRNNITNNGDMVEFRRRVRHVDLQRQLRNLRHHLQCIATAVTAMERLLEIDSNSLHQQRLSMQMHSVSTLMRPAFGHTVSETSDQQHHTEVWSPTVLEDWESDIEQMQPR